MKLKMLKGIGYDICDSIASPPFHSVNLTKEKIPILGKWIINLKDNSAKDDKGKTMKLDFVKKYHDWFLKQLKNADISIEKIKKAELIIGFDLKNKERTNWCSCTIEVDDRKYYYEKEFAIFHFIG